MTKLTKLSLVAAVAVCRINKRITHASLEASNSKNVDVSGQCNFRYSRT